MIWLAAGGTFVTMALVAGGIAWSITGKRTVPAANVVVAAAPDAMPQQETSPNQAANTAQAEVPAVLPELASAAAGQPVSNPAADESVAAKRQEVAAEIPQTDAAVNGATEATRPSSELAVDGGPVGRKISEFTAAAIDNTTYHSQDRTEKVLVVAFLGVECPLANLAYPNLASLSTEFASQSVAFVAVNSNDQDSINAVREQARTQGVKFPVLKDAGNEVANLFGATRTPEFFVLDEQRVVRYHGMIDDQYGYQSRRQAPSQRHVAEAVQSLLAGKDVAVSETPLQGCHIGRRGSPVRESQTSFYRDVLPILQDRCQQCHRTGEIGPFALQDYQACSDWGETIKEAVSERRMPPWPADSPHGEFLNETRLSEAELAMLVKWVDEGCPEGTEADKPPGKEFVDGWNIGTPDREFAMDKPFQVPATGVIDYQHFIVSPVFTKDVWVQAVECKAGERSVVHHMLALLNFPKDEKRSQDGLKNGFFAAGAPGSNYLVFPPGQAKRIPKGAQLVLQMHYTPNGTPTKDQSRLGIKIAQEPVDYEVQTYAIGTTDILIKAGDANYTKTYTEPIDQEVTISALMPHLHLRGKSFKMEATTPDGTTRNLISLPRWDFNWQYQYQLSEPMVLPKGSKISVTAAWDNSELNPNNILPPVDVRFGEQTFDEMFIGYVNFIIPKQPAAGTKGSGRPRG
ncbi:MAG: redoxin domain-containing protein [Planctomycetaceae bacterium]